MPEEVLFESERSRDRAEVASYLRRVADTLEVGDSLTLSAGGESVTMTIPERPTFEVKAEREGPVDGSGELSVEFEIEWDETDGDGDASDDLRIE
jgi:amphi-Trp domain-containing protein